MKDPFEEVRCEECAGPCLNACGLPSMVGAHGRTFCSMTCADAWEASHPVELAESNRKANCSAYLRCVHAAFFELPHLPTFASCEADCPLRKAP